MLVSHALVLLVTPTPMEHRRRCAHSQRHDAALSTACDPPAHTEQQREAIAHLTSTSMEGGCP
jgi:hypothetical protein